MSKLKSLGSDAQPFLPYGRHIVRRADIRAVVEVLRSDWLTQGPRIPEFEEALANAVHSTHAVACSSGTAALHLAMLALGIQSGDRVVTSPMSFAATANCIRFVGADVIFVDIDADTGLMDVNKLAETLKRDHDRKVKAVLPVHFAGQAADLATIRTLTERHGARLVDDACHALGGSYGHDSTTVTIGAGIHADLTVFSFHPVKHVAMGEGGAVVTNDKVLEMRLRQFRNHGIERNHFECVDMATAPDGQANPWYYELAQLGFNYRVTDIQAALGLQQLVRLPDSVKQRNRLAKTYDRLLVSHFPEGGVTSLQLRSEVYHAYHLYVVLIDFVRFGISRGNVMRRLRSAGIGTQVHYIPIHLHPYYRRALGTALGDFPASELFYDQALSLPMYFGLKEKDCQRVISELAGALGR